MGYVDGSNLETYGTTTPLGLVDPTGLIAAASCDSIRRSNGLLPMDSTPNGPQAYVCCRQIGGFRGMLLEMHGIKLWHCDIRLSPCSTLGPAWGGMPVTADPNHARKMDNGLPCNCVNAIQIRPSHPKARGVTGPGPPGKMWVGTTTSNTRGHGWPVSARRCVGSRKTPARS